MKKKKLLSVLVAAALSCSLFAAVPVVSQAAGTTGDPMYRLYNPNSGEHLYTKSFGEKNILTSVGWTYEGIAWTAPTSSNTPVYRVYNPNSGEHHYTMNAGEKDILVGLGWNDEGIGWYGLAAGGQDPQPVDVLNSISLSSTSVDLQVGKTTTLKVNYDPSNYSGDKSVTWTSSNTSVATVNNSGVVTAASAGTATITASVNGKSASCIVNVVQAPSKSGFEIVKEYIVANGERKNDGYTCYQYYTDGALGMTYKDNGKLMFVFMYDTEKATTSAVIGFSEDDNVATALADYGVKDGLNVTVSADPIKKTYDAAQDTLAFSYYSGSKALYDAMGSDSMDEAGSAALKLGFILWNKWLKNIGTSINDVGFPSYSGA